MAQRSGWQAVLSEAGGLSAALALSEESMLRLKYCLHWLQVRSFIVDNIDTKGLFFLSFSMRQLISMLTFSFYEISPLIFNPSLLMLLNQHLVLRFQKNICED